MKAALFATLFVVGAASVYGSPTSPPRATSPPAVKDKVAALSKKCADEQKLTPEQSKLSFNQEIPKTEEEKCYLECVYSGVKVIQDGAFSLEGGKALVAARFTDEKEIEAATHLVETCAKEIKKGEEKCHLGKAIRECFVENGKEVNFFPTAA